MKHKNIPVINEVEWSRMSVKQLKKEALQFFKANFSGKFVYNEEKGIKINLTNTGATHVLWARKAGYENIHSMLE